MVAYERGTIAGDLQFCKGNILDILQNPPLTLYFEDQDSKPSAHNSCVEERRYEAEEAGPDDGTERDIFPNQPSELGSEQLPDYNSLLEDSVNLQYSRRRNSVVFLNELSEVDSNLQVSSILCNPVLKVSPEETVPGGKLDVGCGTEAEEIHAVRQNIVFL